MAGRHPPHGGGPQPRAAALLRSLADIIDEHARTRGGEAAFFCNDASLTWEDYARASDRLAGKLVALGLEPGERVAVLLPDTPAVHVAFVAAEKAGALAVGIGPRAAAGEIRHLLEVSGARALVSRAEHRDLDMAARVAELRAAGLPLEHHLVVEDAMRAQTTDAPSPAPIEGRRLAADVPFLLNSTSGTTGLPKCVIHDQRRWFAFHALAVEAGELRGEDIFCSAIPAPLGGPIIACQVQPAVARFARAAKLPIRNDLAMTPIRVESVYAIPIVKLLRAANRHRGPARSRLRIFWPLQIAVVDPTQRYLD